MGAGVCGLACACELLDRGADVTLFEAGPGIGADACSWWAGGMLAPWCERESAELEVLRLGVTSFDWWRRHTRSFVANGSLVVTHDRDGGELQRFADLTGGYRWLDRAEIDELEPALGGRFSRGLLVPGEAHVEPRRALRDLLDYIRGKGGVVRFDSPRDPASIDADVVLDCRGMAARDRQRDLRGVRGEMVIVESDSFVLSRPVRVLHPRTPAYVVPRGRGRFLVGATMIENESRHPASVRSLLDLLGAAWALAPELGEAAVLETGAGLRPAYPDNLPAVRREGRVVSVNGLFRHGFLLAPAYAGIAAVEALNVGDGGGA